MTTNPPAPRARRLSKGQYQGKKIKDGKGVDIGKPLGDYDTASVREKVRKWQTQGGGVVAAEDGVEDMEVLEKKSPRCRNDDKYDGGGFDGDNSHRHPLPYADKSKSLSPSPSPVRGSGRSTSRPSEKKKTQMPPAKPRHNDLDEDVKNASAPKKRVVSDSRWRKTQEARSAKKYGSPQHEPVAERPTSRTGERRPPSPSKATLRMQRRSSSSSRHVKAVERTYDSKENSTQHDSSHRKLSGYPDLDGKRSHRRRSSIMTPEAIQADKRDKRATPSPTRNNAIYKSSKDSSTRKHVREKVTHDGKKYMMSGALNYSTAPEMELNLDPLANAKHEEGAELGNPSVKPHYQVETPTKAPSNRIEAWLTSTPDPFTEPNQIGADAAKQDSKSHVDPMSSSVSRKKRKESYGDNIGSHDKLQNSRTCHDKTRGGEDGGRKRPTSSHGFAKNADQDTEIKDGRSQSMDDDSPTPSPTSLKRRGARRKMQQAGKSKPPENLDGTRELIDDENLDAPSTFTSSTTESGEVQGLSMDELLMRRPFPTTGKRLSTIVSVATQNTKAQGRSPSVASRDTQTTERPHRKPVSSTALKKPEMASTIKPGTTATKKTSLKRKLTTHADLMSVLSIPREESGSIVSARSIRTSRTRLATATVDDLMKEVASDEAKYTRELRTLVDGVIPVLLSCVLSKAESATAAGLFSRSPSSSGASVTRPIVDMGVALDRLKSVHNRIPTDSSDKFLAWAQTTKKIYADYIKAWRLGFQDVVVNLAPATDAEQVDGAAWDEGLSRNDDGYLVGGDGERVDVAFLLKRPLVRLKYLSKTVKVRNKMLSIIFNDLSIKLMKSKGSQYIKTFRNCRETYI